MTKNWPSGLRDTQLLIRVSYFSKKSIIIILSFYIAIHCSNLVFFWGFDYDGGWCHQNVNWNFDTLGCLVVNLQSWGTPLPGSTYKTFPSKASFKAEGRQGGLEIRVRTTGVCVPSTYQVRLKIQEEWCQEDGLGRSLCIYYWSVEQWKRFKEGISRAEKWDEATWEMVEFVQ